MSCHVTQNDIVSHESKRKHSFEGKVLQASAFVVFGISKALYTVIKVYV